MRRLLRNMFNASHIKKAAWLYTNKDRFEEIAEGYLRDLLTHAKQHVPYYAGVLEGVDTSRFSMKDLSSLPLLTKETIRTHFDALCSDDLNKRKRKKNSSGGSTGEPVPFLQDSDYQDRVNTSLYYYYKYLVGIDWAASKKVMVWGSDKDIFSKTSSIWNKIKNNILQTKFINAFTPFTDETLQEHTTMINKFKPDIIKGYTSSLVDIAEYAKHHSIHMHSPKVIMTAAEPLDDYKREILSSVFGTTVLNFYGSRETSSIAGEVTPGKFLVFLFNNIVEIIDGQVVVTNLHNFSMPLIRFNIGDLSDAVSDTNNEYGLPILSTVSGRFFDIFEKTNGERYHSQYIVRLFFHKPRIQKFQIEQTSPGHILLRVQKRVGLEEDNKDIAYIENEIRRMIGNEGSISRKWVDEIPKTASGKYLYTINSSLNIHGRGVGTYSSSA